MNVNDELTKAARKTLGIEAGISTNPVQALLDALCASNVLKLCDEFTDTPDHNGVVSREVEYEVNSQALAPIVSIRVSSLVKR